MGHLIHDLALVLCVAAVTSAVFRRLGQPTILGYLFAGLVVGPYIPIPVFADAERIAALSEFGVVLVMFGVGLEFSLRKLIRVLPLAGFTGIVQVAALGLLGFGLARALGLPQTDGLFLGCCICISSTMVVAKVFDENPPAQRVREFVLGILVVQDLVAIVLVAILTGVAAGVGLSPEALGTTLGNLVVLLVTAVIVGLMIIPRYVRHIATLGTEILLVGAAALCFGLASLAEHLGFSVALGAFLAGTLVAESGRTNEIEHLVHPIRDLFAAVFFVSVGMSIDPVVALDSLGLAVAVAAIVILGQLIAVGTAGILSGNGVRRSITSGLALGQVGEFAFIIAGIGATAGVVGDYLQPVVVTVAVITTFTTPVMNRYAERIAKAAEHALPRPLQTFASLCESWFVALRRVSPTADNSSHLRTAVVVIAMDTAVIASIWVLIAWRHPELTGFIESAGVPSQWSIAVLSGVGLVLMLPLGVALLRATRRAGQLLSERVIPPSRSGVDLGLAPRRALIVTLQAMVVIGVSAPILVVLTPLISTRYLLAGFAILVAILCVYFWRSAMNLQGHVRAGSGALADLLKQQMSDEEPSDLPKPSEFLPGLGAIRSFTIPEGAAIAGKTLAQLDIRAATGATVIAIVRADTTIAMPTASDPIREGDTVALTGAEHAVEAARVLLLGP